MAATQTQDPTTVPMSDPQAPAPGGPAGPGSADRRPGTAAALRPLLILDVGLPLGTYYLLRRGMGTDMVTALTVSSIGPAARTVWGVVRERSINALAALMLATTVLGIGLSYVTGDPRLMIAKDSVTSSVVAMSIIFFSRSPGVR